MITKCKDCPHCQTNNVYPLSNREYCNKWYKEVDPDQEACDYAKNYLKVKDKQILKKKLFDCTIKEVSELCENYNIYCKDEEGNFCPLMAVNDPFNECILMHMAKNPAHWINFADKEI